MYRIRTVPAKKKSASAGIRRIVFLGDLLRVQENAGDFADRSLNWEYSLLGEQVKMATGLPVEVVLTSDKHRFDRERFCALCGLPMCTESWVRVASGHYTKKAARYFCECFSDALIVTQVAGALKKMMDDAGIPYIDIYVSALKFMDDLHFAFRSNLQSVTDKLLQYRMSESAIVMEASKIRAYYAGRNSHRTPLKENSLLICGQTGIDLSLVYRGRLVTFLDYKEKLRALTAFYDHVYYKPHPYASPDSESERFIRSLDKVEIIKNQNFYRLLSDRNLKAVAALSSGTLKEAPYFGKTAHTISHEFIRYYQGDGIIRPDEFIVVTGECFSPAFWADILSGILHTRECEAVSFAQSSLLRRTLDTWWDYELGRESDVQLRALERRMQEMDKKMAAAGHNLKRVVDNINTNIVSRCGTLDEKISRISAPPRTIPQKLGIEKDLTELKIHAQRFIRPPVRLAFRIMERIFPKHSRVRQLLKRWVPEWIRRTGWQK